VKVGEIAELEAGKRDLGVASEWKAERDRGRAEEAPGKPVEPPRQPPGGRVIREGKEGF
jgi:hypothetical protein